MGLQAVLQSGQQFEHPRLVMNVAPTIALERQTSRGTEAPCQRCAGFIRSGFQSHPDDASGRLRPLVATRTTMGNPACMKSNSLLGRLISRYPCLLVRLSPRRPRPSTRASLRMEVSDAMQPRFESINHLRGPLPIQFLPHQNEPRQACPATPRLQRPAVTVHVRALHQRNGQVRRHPVLLERQIRPSTWTTV